MKGIKECLNWLIDNPMKAIVSEGFRPVRYNDGTTSFEFNSNFEESWFCFEGDEFHVFKEGEWVKS